MSDKALTADKLFTRAIAELQLAFMLKDRELSQAYGQIAEASNPTHYRPSQKQKSKTLPAISGRLKLGAIV